LGGGGDSREQDENNRAGSKAGDNYSLDMESLKAYINQTPQQI